MTRDLFLGSIEEADKIYVCGNCGDWSQTETLSCKNCGCNEIIGEEVEEVEDGTSQ